MWQFESYRSRRAHVAPFVRLTNDAAPGEDAEDQAAAIAAAGTGKAAPIATRVRVPSVAYTAVAFMRACHLHSSPWLCRITAVFTCVFLFFCGGHSQTTDVQCAAMAVRARTCSCTAGSIYWHSRRA